MNPDDKNYQKRRDLPRRYFNVKDSWDRKKETEDVDNNSLFKMVFVFSGVFFVLTLIIAFIVFYFDLTNKITTDKIDIRVSGGTIVESGKPMLLNFAITNSNPVDIESTSLLIRYPKGSYDENGSKLVTKRYPLSTIKIGERKNISINPTFYGLNNDNIYLDIDFEYKPQGSYSFFTFNRKYNLKIEGAHILTNVESLELVETGKNISLELSIKSNSSKEIKDAYVMADFPSGFSLKRVTRNAVEIKFEEGDDTFNVGNIAPNDRDFFVFDGVLVGSSGIDKIFNFYVLLDTTDKVRLSSIEHRVGIEDSFFSGNVDIIGESVRKNNEIFFAEGGERLVAKIDWENKSSSKIYDAEISARVRGNGVNLSTIQVFDNGEYDEGTNLIYWNKREDSSLEEINRGKRGDFNFSFETIRTDPLYIEENRVVYVDVFLKGKRISKDRVQEEINLIEAALIKIPTDISSVGNTLYLSGNIKNTGPVPPVVGKETTYTLFYTIQNRGNLVEDAKVKIFLEPGVVFTGNSNPSEEKLEYNEEDNSILWDIGDMTASGNGHTRNLYMQVSILPKRSQIGKLINLSKRYEFSAYDTFIEEEIISENYDVLDTSFHTEPVYSEAYGYVQEVE